MKTALLLQIAGLFHIGLLCAGASLPRVVGFGRNLTLVPELLRRLFYVYYVFLGGILVALGTISFFLADQLAAGGPVARALLLFMTLFWTARLLVALFIFDVKPYLTNRWRWCGYQLMNIVFLYLPVVYAYTFVQTLRMP
jgi:hypothetical protein